MNIEISPGWYVDPEDSSQYRYWNGNEWTGSTAKNDTQKPVKESDDIFLVNSNLETSEEKQTKKLSSQATLFWRELNPHM